MARHYGPDAIKMLRERGKLQKGNTMKYQIWYMKPSSLRGVVGSSPDLNNLSATHVHLIDIEADDQEDALSRMRADNWSPNGEALDLLQSKGLQHTTMTIGDVLVDESDAIYLVTGIGMAASATAICCESCSRPWCDAAWQKGWLMGRPLPLMPA
jgi:hypothetical protein